MEGGAKNGKASADANSKASANAAAAAHTACRDDAMPMPICRTTLSSGPSDMPASADQYLHRVARAGRFGTKGMAISFVTTDEDAEILNQVQSRLEVQIDEMPDEVDASTYTEAD